MRTMKTLLLLVMLQITSALMLNMQNNKDSKELKKQNNFNVNMHSKSCHEKIGRTIPFEKGAKILRSIWSISQ